MNNKIIVISGINLLEGGPLSIYYDCLEAIKISELWKKYHWIAFVHKRELFEKYQDIVELIELPKSRNNYLCRLYYEYVYFYKFSQQRNIYVWFSLHDITPRVKADRLYTYCHNPSPFMKRDIKKIKYGWKVVTFSYLYKYLYRINIKSATAVIVQQDWMRQKFLRMYPIKRVIVARPKMPESYQFEDRSGGNTKTVFIYAAYPRFFKNYEVILEACRLLENRSRTNFEVWLTINGAENAYSSNLKMKYRSLRTVRWLGVLSRKELFRKYEESDCMIFPSQLETWGLPISEYKSTGKPMVLADLPYAHEALGDYSKVVFFDQADAGVLSKIIENVTLGNVEYHRNFRKEIKQPHADNWRELLKMILSESYGRITVYD